MKAHSDLQILNNKWSLLTDIQGILIGLVPWFHFIKITCTFIMFLCMMGSPLDISIFRLPETTCRGTIEICVVLCIFLVFWPPNLLDVAISMDAGEKLWGKFAFYTSLACTFINAALIPPLYLDWKNANISGYNSFTNLFQDQRACSIPDWYNNAANLCARRNPNLLSLPGVTLTIPDLIINWLGCVIFFTLIVMTIFDGLKAFCLYGSGESDAVAKEAQLFAQKANKTLMEGFVEKTYATKEPTLKQLEPNIYESIQFTGFFSPNTKRLFYFCIVFSMLYYLMMMISFAWFLQQMKAIIDELQEISGVLYHKHEIPDIGVFLFFLLIGVNIWFWALVPWSGNFEWNPTVKKTHIIACLLHGIQFIWACVYLMLANRGGQKGNPANSYLFCTALDPVTGEYMYQNPANGCRNDFTCPSGLVHLANTLWPSAMMIFITIYCFSGTLYYFTLTVFTFIAEPFLAFYRAQPDYVKIAIKNTIESNIKQKIYPGPADSYEDYVNGMNQGKGQVGSTVYSSENNQQSILIPQEDPMELSQSQQQPIQTNGKKSFLSKMFSFPL